MAHGVTPAGEIVLTDEKLANLLKERKALIVHFSHHANMGRGRLFPFDLNDAIQNQSCWELSCHAIWPGHKMELVGSVGIILEPLVKNVLTVDNCDSGSSEYGSGGEPLTIESFHRSFQVSDGKYNEWRICDAKVTGIFVSNPNCILTRQVLPPIMDGHECGQTTSAESTKLEKVFEAFPDFPVLTMGAAGPEEVPR